MIGTTSVVLDTTEKHGTDLDHEVLSMPSPFAGEYLVWAENGLAGKVVEHVLEHVVHATDELGDHATDDPFASLDRVLAAVPPGSGNILFLPWLAGSLSPSANGTMRGGFLNLSLDTERRHLVRAVIEGLGFNLGWLLPVVEGFSGHRGDEIVFGGGAARSAEWVQTLGATAVNFQPVDRWSRETHDELWIPPEEIPELMEVAHELIRMKRAGAPILNNELLLSCWD